MRRCRADLTSYTAIASIERERRWSAQCFDHKVRLLFHCVFGLPGYNGSARQGGKHNRLQITGIQIFTWGGRRNALCFSRKTL